MEDTQGFLENELSTEISKDGENLTIIASKVDEDHWELSVKNGYGVRSVWLEYYSTAQKAVDAGIRAIRSEGVESFASTEGFEYLHDESV